VPPVNGQTFIDSLGFTIPRFRLQHLNECEWVVIGTDPAREHKDKSSECLPSLVIDKDEITSFPAVKSWAAAKIVCLRAPVDLRFVIYLEEPILGNLDVIQIHCETGMLKK